ncbi:phosphate ABC transporter permease subunit PstC [Nocardioides sp. CBS4Y-1]|uniref:Phosphate transport system permease protein n=1 Tax=Nocardioides acrostichi TaxID=2784339 RepID=A0A930UZF4_9ACTN|nr:phosphate ABC transporter permease subunit PstC [Nocardioides acrostichi]
MSGGSQRGDRVFHGLAFAAGASIMVALAGVFIFLAIRGAAGFSAATGLYQPYTSFVPYAAGLLFGTALVAVLAMIIAVPFAVGVALFLTHYAPRPLSTVIAYLIDLLAAVPSVVFGLWGLKALGPALLPIQRWLNEHLGFIPFFAGEVSATGRTVFLAAIVLAIMVLPITTAICREVFGQTPRLHEEAALALGATRWEMIRYAVLPHSRSGIIAGTMLGLGRALGETMAVLLVLNASGPKITWHLLTSDNPATIASNIAQNFQGENIDLQVVLLATGLVLFVFTFLVNFAARWVVIRSERKFQ